ncbi:MAG: methyl-accepting chemotaxis protein [Deltaproteobacteria bacterium]|nr:methyl-accepting chemotaxis protein [Deltaproteobacteria bacterium]
MKIGTRVALGFSILLMVVFVTTAAFSYLSSNLLDQFVRARRDILTFAQLAKQMELDVFQLQHWTEEISSGIGEQAEAAQMSRMLNNDFSDALENFRVYYEDFNDKEGLRKILELEELFKEFKEKGGEMTNAYIRQGTAAGNRLMPGYNKISDRLVSKVEEISETENSKLSRELNLIIESISTANTLFPLLAVVALLFGIFISVAITRSIRNPLNHFSKALEDMALGRIDINLGEFRNDELGQMAKAIEAFAENMKFSTLASLRRVSQGDLSMEVEVKSEMDELGLALQQTVANLNKLITEITQAANQIAVGAAEVSNTSHSLSQGAYEQQVSLDMITDTINDLTAKTSGNAANSSLVSQLAQGFQMNADHGTSSMGEMVASMLDINSSSREISKIITVIDEIAFQTNLLSLNAAVEAARAGAYGKGFAVVADEVHNLAIRSAKAARDVSALIESTVKKVQKGTEIAQTTQNTLIQVVGGFQHMTSLLESIASSSNEQAADITNISQTLGQIDNVTHQNAAAAEESAAAAEELNGQMEYLRKLVGQFRLKETEEEAPPERRADFSNQENFSPEGLLREDDFQFGEESALSGGSEPLALSFENDSGDSDDFKS